jgi:hypothetical protein
MLSLQVRDTASIRTLSLDPGVRRDDVLVLVVKGERRRQAVTGLRSLLHYAAACSGSSTDERTR